jgi:spermidine/putrescine transport system permease protein
MKRLHLRLLAPSATVIAVLIWAPLAVVVSYSFLSRGAYGGVMRPWTAENYLRVFDPLYVEILWRSAWIAALSTCLCLIFGFPLALYISRARKRKTLLLNLVMLPFWTSFLIRIYGWMFLLRDTGLVNSILLHLRAVSEPLPLLYNSGSVILGLVYGFLPFMVLPLYATIEKIEPTLLEAAEDLGVSSVGALWRIVIPLSRSGMIAGCLLVFIPCLGAFLTPDLMGGGKTVMVGTLVQNQFTTARNWPFGAATSLLLMALVIAVTLALRHRGEELV